MQAGPAERSVLAPEDEGRSDIYGLLGRLYADGPDAALLASIAGAPRMEGASAFAGAWNRLADASGAIEAADAMQEYTDLFVGVGKSEVNLHASFWISGFTMERPLAQLRGELATLGLTRREGVNMLEDHLSALCESMRMLIAGDAERGPASYEIQRAFFERNLAPWVFDCCIAIGDSPIANFYRGVAECTSAFMTIDREALAMDD
ncbi:MAG: molecular chaperone TorD family protein [Proteobacteria bacterium]|nr:molecular chaperone TorD family protein [Pseudomonadota bacterium]